MFIFGQVLKEMNWIESKRICAASMTGSGQSAMTTTPTTGSGAGQQEDEEEAVVVAAPAQLSTPVLVGETFGC